jgi:hypothetical protein
VNEFVLLTVLAVVVVAFLYSSVGIGAIVAALP